MTFVDKSTLRGPKVNIFERSDLEGVCGRLAVLVTCAQRNNLPAVTKELLDIKQKIEQTATIVADEEDDRL